MSKLVYNTHRIQFYFVSSNHLFYRWFKSKLFVCIKEAENTIYTFGLLGDNAMKLIMSRNCLFVFKNNIFVSNNADRDKINLKLTIMTNK